MASIIPKRLSIISTIARTKGAQSSAKSSVKPYCSFIIDKQEHKYVGLASNNSSICTTLQKNSYICYISERKYSIGSKKTTTKPENDDKREEEKLTLFQKFKKMYKDYWYVLVPVHLATSACWFGGFYYLATSGVDIPALLESMNFNEKIVASMRNSSMGYFAITYGLYKIATPARYAITLGGTTISINYLKQWGYIKPMPTKERLKEIYAEKKEGLREKREHLMESMHHMQKTVKETKEGIKETKDQIVSSVKESGQNIKHIKKKVISDKSETKP